MATVDNSGYVSAPSEGSAVITASSVSTGSVKGSVSINVTSKDVEAGGERLGQNGGGGGGCDTGIGAAIILILAALSVKHGINSRKRKR